MRHNSQLLIYAKILTRYLFYYFLFLCCSVSYATNVFNSTDNISLSHNRYQPYFELGGVKYFNQNTSVAGIYDLFIPLAQFDDSLFFSDLRIFDRSGSSFEGNIHIGYRKLRLDRRQLFGVYSAFDRKRSDNQSLFNQVTLGLEYWQNQWFIGGNFYHPLGESKKVFRKDSENLTTDEQTSRSIAITKNYEKSLIGLDAEIGYATTASLTLYAGGYYFESKDVNTVVGPKARLTYTCHKPYGRILGVLDGIGVEAGAQYDRARGTTAYIGIKLKVGLTNLDRNSNISGFERHMVELVRRDPDIVIGTGQKKRELSGKQGYTYIPSEEFHEKSLEELLEEFGLPKGSTFGDVKKRYHELVFKTHPDKGGSTEAFIRVRRLYEILEQRLNSSRIHVTNSFRRSSSNTSSFYTSDQVSDFQDNGREQQTYVSENSGIVVSSQSDPEHKESQYSEKDSLENISLSYLGFESQYSMDGNSTITTFAWESYKSRNGTNWFTAGIDKFPMVNHEGNTGSGPDDFPFPIFDNHSNDNLSKPNESLSFIAGSSPTYFLAEDKQILSSDYSISEKYNSILFGKVGIEQFIPREPHNIFVGMMRLGGAGDDDQSGSGDRRERAGDRTGEQAGAARLEQQSEPISQEELSRIFILSFDPPFRSDGLPLLEYNNGYTAWLTRFVRILNAYRVGLIPRGDLNRFQMFLLGTGQFNANFVLEELNRLGYPRSPFAIMHRHTYLRATETWAMEMLRMVYQDHYVNNRLFPIWVDSPLFWDELNRYCRVIPEGAIDFLLPDTIRLFLERGYIDQPVWIELHQLAGVRTDAHKKEIEKRIKLLVLVEVMHRERLPIELQPLFQAILFDDTQGIATRFGNVPQIMDDLNRHFPDILDAKRREVEQTRQELKMPEDKLEDRGWFGKAFGMAKKYQIPLPALGQEQIRNVGALMAYAREHQGEFRAFLDRVYAAIQPEVPGIGAYIESIQRWLIINLKERLDIFLSQVVYYFRNQFKDTEAIVFSDCTGTPEFVNSVLGNIGYRIDPVRATRIILRHFPGLFINHQQTGDFWKLLMKTTMVASLPEDERSSILRLRNVILRLIDDSHSFPIRNMLPQTFRWELDQLQIILRYSRDPQNGFELYGRYLDRYLSDYLYLNKPVLLLVADIEIRQALRTFLFAWGQRSLATVVRTVQTVAEIMMLDLEHQPLLQLLPETVQTQQLCGLPVRSVLMTPYAMRAFVRVFQALDSLYVGRAANIFVTNQNYFEWLSSLSRLRRECFMVLPVRHLSEINETADIIFAEIHPNNVVELRQFAHDIGELLQRMHSWRRVKPRTLVLDVTLNYLGGDEVQRLLRRALALINRGQLNIILIQSLTKFAQLGLDVRSGGLFAVINNGGVAWAAVNRRLSELKGVELVDPSTVNFFSYFAQLNRLVEHYIRLINRNVRFVYNKIKEQLDQLEIFRRDRFQITMSTDPRACYVAINMNGLLPEVDQGFVLGTADIEVFANDLLRLLLHPLCEFLGLPLTERMSIGFPLSSVNPVFDAMRFTIGLEAERELELYAEVLAYTAFVLNRQRDAQLFFDFCENDRDGKPVYTLRYNYFREKVEQFKAMTPGSRYRYWFEFESPDPYNSYRPSLDQESRQLRRIVILGNSLVRLFREVPDQSVNGRRTCYIPYTSDTIYVPVRELGKRPLSALSVQQRRMCIACLTEYAPYGKQNHQNVNLLFTGRLPTEGAPSVTLASMEEFGNWNMRFVYGPFFLQRNSIFFYLYQKRVNLLFNGGLFTEKNVVVEQGGVRTPLLDLPLEEREFLFREGDYRLDRSGNGFYQLYPQFLDKGSPGFFQTRIDMQYIPQGGPINFYIQDGKLIIERDFISYAGVGVTIYKRFLGERLTCFEVDFWGEKDPILARFMRLMVAVYIQAARKIAGSPVSFFAQSERFFRFVFDLRYDEGDKLFAEAVEHVMRNKNAVQRLLTSYKRANLHQYKFNTVRLNWPSPGDSVVVDYIFDKDLIDQALVLLRAKQDERSRQDIGEQFAPLTYEKQIAAARFLDNITGRYIEAVRHAEAGAGNPNRIVLWGGDIELGAIANVLNLRITVYRPAVVEGGDLQNDHPIGPAGGRQINLWYEHGHYENYEPETRQHTDDVPGDGNCLFYAVLRAVYQLEEHAEEYRFATDAARDEVRVLREQITDDLRERIAGLNPEQNPIRVRFAMVFGATNRRQLREAIAYLPNGALREGIIDRLPEDRRSFLVGGGAKLPKFMLGLFDSISMPLGSYPFWRRALAVTLLFLMSSGSVSR